MKVEQVTAYKTSDGTLFEDLEQARQHELKTERRRMVYDLCGDYGLTHDTDLVLELVEKSPKTLATLCTMDLCDVEGP